MRGLKACMCRGMMMRSSSREKTRKICTHMREEIIFLLLTAYLFFILANMHTHPYIQ